MEERKRQVLKMRYGGGERFARLRRASRSVPKSSVRARHSAKGHVGGLCQHSHARSRCRERRVARKTAIRVSRMAALRSPLDVASASVVLRARCDPRSNDCKIGGWHFRLALRHRPARQDRDELRGLRLHARVAASLTRKVIAPLLTRIVASGPVAIRGVLRVGNELRVNLGPSRSCPARATRSLTGMSSAANGS